MAYNNAFSDLFKNSFDFNQLISTQRRNIEALSAANQVVVESIQTISRRQAEVARANVENTLKASKDMMTGGTPDVSKSADLAKSFFESALSNLRECGEMVAKSSLEAFDVLNRRAAETLEEISAAANSNSPASTSSKKKSA